jgi:SAM-dependent methyltransferase
MVSQSKFLKQLNTNHYLLFISSEWDDRHTVENQKKWGVWRWRGMCEYKDSIVKIVKKSKKIIDFGGALGPLCPNAVIVDREKKDIWGRDIKYHNISDCPGQYDMIFSSHTLEHVLEFQFILTIMLNKLKPGGKLVLHLPSVYNFKWWPQNERKKEHKRIFALSGSLYMHAPIETVYIDKCFSLGSIETAAYTGDSSIMMIVRKEYSV